MSRKNQGSQKSSKAVNDLEALRWKWMVHIESLAMSRFKWYGLPDTVSERFLERTLMTRGQAIFFDLGGIFMATQVMPKGRRDQYDDYSQWTAIGSSGFSEEISDKEGVMIWDNLTRKNKYPIMQLFADDLAEIDSQARTNRRQQSSITIFSGPEENAGDLAALARGLEMHESSVIAINKIHDETKITAIQTGIQYLQKEFHADRIATLNSLYSSLGIEHIPFEKSERLLSAEAGIATDAVARIREDSMVARQIACDEINKKFDLNVSVEWRSNQYDELNSEAGEEPTQEPDKEKDNG